MAYYGDEIVEEVRARSDIVDVISGYIPLKKKGSRYFGLCPFHNEKTPSFSVSAQDQMYYCFGCSAGGNVFTFLMQYENLTFQEAVEQLAGRAGMQIEPTRGSAAGREKAERKAQLFQIQKEAALYFVTLLRGRRGERALDYFHERQLTDETIRRFGLGYADKYGDDLYRYLKSRGWSDELLRDSGLVTFSEKRGGSDKFWNRAMFPIMDVRDRVIGFGGRVMGDGEPKYLNSPETDIFEKSRNLYGLNFARRSRRGHILLGEGYMDVIALHQAGFDNAVASLGTSFTAGHAGLLKRFTKEVYLTFDSDEAGIRAALRAIPLLKDVGLKVRVVSLEPYKDPDEFIKARGADAYEQRIREAENSFFFEIRIMERDYDLQDPESRTDFFRQTAGRILQFEDDLERDSYMQAVADRYMINIDQFRQLVSRTAASGTALRGQTAAARTRPSGDPQVKGVSGTRTKQPPEDGYHTAQRMLLFYLARYPHYYETVRAYISAEDFADPLYREIAAKLFAQIQNGETDLSALMHARQDEESLREIARIFSVNEYHGGSERELKQAVSDALYRVKKESFEYRCAAGSIPFDQILAEKKQLEELRRQAHD